MRFRRGDIWLVDLEPIRPGELGKRRPCVIASENAYNDSSTSILIMPITSYSPGPRAPEMLASGQSGLRKNSSVLPLHIRAVAKSRFLHRMGRAPVAVVEQSIDVL